MTLGRDGEHAGLLVAREIAMGLARRLALLLLPIALAVAPIAIGQTAESPVAANSLRGQLLVAEPELDDSNFDHTVVLLLQHGPDGAQGIVLNRPYGTAPTAELLRRLGQKGDGVRATRLFYGGRSSPRSGWCCTAPLRAGGHTADHRGPRGHQQPGGSPGSRDRQRAAASAANSGLCRLGRPASSRASWRRPGS